jgi:hypothetical protein
MKMKAGKNSESLKPSAFKLTQKITVHMRNCAIYWTMWLAKWLPNWLKLDHLPGAMAIQLMLEPAAKKIKATTTMPSPSQMAHQSSFKYSSFQPMWVGAGGASSAQALVSQ